MDHIIFFFKFNLTKLENKIFAAVDKKRNKKQRRIAAKQQKYLTESEGITTKIGQCTFWTRDKGSV